LEVVVPDRVITHLEHLVEVHVRPVVVHRDRDVARITTDAEIGDAFVVGQAVQRSVGLDEAPVLLGRELREHVVATRRLLIEPGRHLAQRAVEVRILEHEERAQHLRPGGAALGRRADDDVVVTKLETVPPDVVRHQVPVSHELGHERPPSLVGCGDTLAMPARRIACRRAPGPL
jgi:hypothetical protein